jgi:hypothetical protein
MTASDFSAWVEAMMSSRGWKKIDCARALGVHPSQIGIWSQRGARTYVGLACAAIEEGLEPWGKPRWAEPTVSSRRRA